MEGIIYRIGLPSFHNAFPKDPPASKLEEVLNKAFASRGLKIAPGYFDPESHLYPSHLSFFYFAADPSINPATDKELVGILIATVGQKDDFAFTVYDKIGVIPEKWKNGIMPTMVAKSRMVSNGKQILPAVLRTSSQEAHEKYLKLSDALVKIGDYWVHGFGFMKKGGEGELFSGAGQRFQVAADYVAKKPSTLVPTAAEVQAYGK